MAEQGRWVTVNGAHVFIKDGEAPKFGGKLQKSVPEERRYDQEYKKLEDDVNGLMDKDYDEGTFLSVRARIIESLRKAKDYSKYDALLGKFERDAKKKLGYTDDDLEKMSLQGSRTTVRTRDIDRKINNATDPGSSLEYRDIKNSMAMENEFQKRYKNYKPRKATGKVEKLPWE